LESLSRQSINCTGTDNQKQSNRTLHTPKNVKKIKNGGLDQYGPEHFEA